MATQHENISEIPGLIKNIRDKIFNETTNSIDVTTM
jgi:hypothetical protein